MESILLKISILLIIIILVVLEQKLLKEKFTPLTAFIVPTLVINLIILILKRDLPISIEYYEKYFFVSVIWFLIGIGFKLVEKTIKFQNNEEIFTKFYSYICYLSIFFLIILQITTGLKYGFGNIKGKMGGIFGHLYILTIPFSLKIFIEFYNKRKIKNLLFIFLSLGLLVLGGKYQIILYILPFFLWLIETRSNLFVILLGLAIFSLFYITYLINFYFIGAFKSIELFNMFIIDHFQKYLFSPIYVGNYLVTNYSYVENGLSQVLSPFVNIINLFIGNPYISPALVNLKTPVGESNVGGMIPEVYFLIGDFGMYFYMFFFGLISYYFDLLYRKNRNYLYLNYLFKSLLILSFFANGFTLLGYIERIIGALLITGIIYRITKKGNNYNL